MQLLVEVSYINYRYLEKKAVLEQISDQPVIGSIFGSDSRIKS
jgi:hypothetical protein